MTQSERRADKLRNRYLANGDKADGFENKYGYNWDYVLVLPVPLIVQRENIIYREKMKVDAISLYKLEEQEMNQQNMPVTGDREKEMERAMEGEGDMGTYLDGDGDMDGDGVLDRQEQGTAGIGSTVKGTTVATATGMGTGTGTGTGRGIPVKDNLQEKERQDMGFKDRDGINLAPSNKTDGLSANEVSTNEKDLDCGCDAYLPNLEVSA